MTSAARLVNATRVYPLGVSALDRVTLDIATGSLTAVIGPSGSGKTTLLNCVAGLDRLTSGQVFLGGVELGPLSRRRLTLERRERVAMVFQSGRLHPALTVAENVSLPDLIRGRRPDTGWIEQIADRLALTSLVGRRPAELSGGELQRVAIARALAIRPELIVADEPTGRLDHAQGEEVLRLLRLAVDDLNQSVLLVTHDPAVARGADRIVCLVDGKIVPSQN